MAGMLNLLRTLYPLRLAPVSSGLDRCTELLCEELPFTVHAYASGQEHNGWVIPWKWEVRRAEIRRHGRVVYDGLAHPLGVIGYSQPFQGTVDREELKRHLFFHPTWPDALVYHCDLYYKVGQKDWGFSVPQTLSNQLEPGTYEVILETVHEAGTMKVCDYLLPGDTQDTIVLNAHNCHAGQANDDISGVVVGVEVMKHLKSQSERRYSYRLIIAPEHHGTVFYLAPRTKAELAHFRGAVFLECLGNDNRFALQESFTGASELDRAMHQVLRHRHPDFFADRFRKIVGNDETVWEAPGYEIPTISLSRFPFPEYHSSHDTDRIISEHRLEEAVDVVLDLVRILETNSRLHRKFDGLVALSHPKYDLYIPTADPSIRPEVEMEQRQWNYLMDCLPRYFDGRMTVLDIAQKHGLPYEKVLAYLERFRDKGLVDFIDHHCGRVGSEIHPAVEEPR